MEALRASSGFDEFASAFRSLGAGASVQVEGVSEDTSATVTRNLKLAGFIAVQHSGDVVSATKPSYEVGAKVSLKKPAQSTAAAAFLKPLGPEENGADEEDDLVDDAEIIADDEIKAAGTKVASACGPAGGGRKPCADCSCGRREEWEKDEPITRPSAPPADKSACGNCSLGDAFRCAGCPYLGLPPFKPGEKVMLSTGVITSDL
eukprot:CAMPEP_0198331486 /NCGR_PEP_ID=MMETSP1450-20131203/17624_1 /TAXON_ID=753684 ORGANISM="Madagascaria erythrocladiodes, Strain CCMP3234" /NCGR_SAMPLE_ID=MMETSP1450 /ASSEMBLY_ACC=CAM_ASM_001115 /LENGTH=204 /DNA_ID=CAMNT_0044035865 /DNA_START=159 /DNA_END=773 /DNA_ORIENTATION=+